MDLADVAASFDEDEVRDAYSDALLFYGHTTPHDDHTSSGATVRRRTLSAAPDAEPPARRVAKIYGEYWLVGNSNDDSFQGETIRRSFGLKKATGTFDLLGPGEACLAAEGLTFYAQKDYYRDTTNPQSTADWDPMWNVICPFTEAFLHGQFLREGSTLYRIRNTYPTVDEFRILEADQLREDALQTVTFTQAGTLDLVTDTLTSSTATTTAIQTDTSKFYQFRVQPEYRLEPGDRAVFVAKSAVTPRQGATFTMQGATWRAALVIDELDAWAILARRT
jgi:hypothetical protein